MKPIYFIDCGTYKEIIRDDKLLFKCPFCGEWFRGLACHTSQKHKIKGEDLRRLFGLKSDYQLTTPEIKARHREISLSNYESHIKHNLIESGNKTRYTKGFEGHLKINWSPQAREELIKRKKKNINLIR